MLAEVNRVAHMQPAQRPRDPLEVSHDLPLRQVRLEDVAQPVRLGPVASAEVHFAGRAVVPMRRE